LIKKKKRRKGNINIQEIYDKWLENPDGDVSIRCDEFYYGTTNLIKAYLMNSLIKKGYYKNGVRQVNFDNEDIDDCFTYVYGKILDKYDPSKGTLPSFVRLWIRGYGTIKTQPQKRKHTYASGKVFSATPITIVPDFCIKSYKKSLTSPSPEDYNNYHITITNGLGIGQRRKIVTNTYKHLIIETPWDVVPDSTSTYNIIGNKYLQSVLSLDLSLPRSICEEFKDPYTFDDLGDSIDEDYFGSHYISTITKEDITEIRKVAACTQLNQKIILGTVY